MNICNTLALSLVVGILSLLGCGGALSSAAYTNTNDEQLIFQQQQKPPLRVFILVGQSNMVGHGARYDIDESTGQQKNATLQWLVDNVPDRFSMLKVKQPNVDVNVEVGVRSGKSGKTTTKKRSDDSEWTVRNDVLMACNSRGFDDLSSRVTDYGKLYAGLCAGEPPKTYDQVGPELGFGWSVGDAFNNGKSDTGGEDNDNKILLLKVAWGGKSLAVDFRPPSSGGTTGPNYISMIDNIKSTTSALGQIFPEEVADNRLVHLSGFAWHQGWNDGCNEVRRHSCCCSCLSSLIYRFVSLLSFLSYFRKWQTSMSITWRISSVMYVMI